MQTLVDPFELACEEAPRVQSAPEQLPGRDSRGDVPFETPAPRIPSSEVWQRVRCWCSEE
jgi:hypothetical protein